MSDAARLFRDNLGMETEDIRDGKLSIYRAARTIKRRENSLYNALRSIYEDSIFVGEISQLWPDLPLLANLRCGLWYSPAFHSSCYFKSTDGHTNNWSFSTARLNLHVAMLAGQKGGCMMVDSTRKGKRFPDSMSKTIPIWTCVLNRAVANYINNMREMQTAEDVEDRKLASFDHWDCELHLPIWVSQKEKLEIEERLEEWTQQLEASGADVASVALCLKKPLRPLWISQRSVIWLNEVPDHDSWDFTPIILVSASASDGVFQHRTTSEFSWHYIAGAGDDEESWARGLSPSHFWKHAYDIISSGPDMCNQKVADIVEKDRVYRAQRGQNAPQITVKSPNIMNSIGDPSYRESSLSYNMSNGDDTLNSADASCQVFWLGSTNLAVGASQAASHASNVNCILNCDQESISVCLPDAESYSYLPIVSSKLDRFSVLNNLPAAVNFARVNIRKGNRLLICCRDGEDISICVCLAILASLFNDEATFDDGKYFRNSRITKWDVRRRLVFVCKFAITARPSRGNLKQVFAFLSGGKSIPA